MFSSKLSSPFKSPKHEFRPKSTQLQLHIPFGSPKNVNQAIKVGQGVLKISAFSPEGPPRNVFGNRDIINQSPSRNLFGNRDSSSGLLEGWEQLTKQINVESKHLLMLDGGQTTNQSFRSGHLGSATLKDRKEDGLAMNTFHTEPYLA